ncbi:hypothetical protein DYB32_007484 [Aphanomyces invadans]|uniref:Transmembrane protein 135 N-terminal domain-containing protein n=1 Tax=Aphanomyces invadans TaxID=157072 RepID=A0A3R6YV51_9STRA|nr:hypothetical protein DYB32_007484 [Aphanomyces invadans]
MERVYSAVFGEDAQKQSLQHEIETRQDDVDYLQHRDDGVGLAIDQDSPVPPIEVHIRPLTPEFLEQHNLQMQHRQYHDVLPPPPPPSASSIAAAPLVTRPLPSSFKGPLTTELSELGGALKAGARAFVLAYGAKAFTALLLASRKWGVDDTNSYADALRLLSQSDTFRFGGFVGALVGSYRATEIVLNYVRGPCTPDDATHKAIAGAVCGLSLFLDTPSRRPVISLYIFIRMLDIYLRHASWQERIGIDKVLDDHPFLTTYSTEMLFALANGPIIYAAAYTPWFISTRSGRESCVAHAVKDWITDGVVRAARLYVPVHFTPLLLFKRRQLVSAPAKTLTQTALATLRSSAFLSSYQALVKVFLCATRNSFHEDYSLSALFGGVLFFCVAMSVILSRRPAHFKPTYLSLLRFVFGASVVVSPSATLTTADERKIPSAMQRPSHRATSSQLVPQ